MSKRICALSLAVMPFFLAGRAEGGPLVNNGALSLIINSTLADGITGTGVLSIGDGINTNTITLGFGSGTSDQDGLLFNGASSLDITNNTLIIDYGAGPDPIAAIAADIASGYNDGAWNGPGIISSTAAASGGSFGIGYADSADPGNPANLPIGTIEIEYALVGDLNLDGSVNGSDLNLLLANYERAGIGWDQGDLNYDGIDSSADLVAMYSNPQNLPPFNQAAALIGLLHAPASPIPLDSAGPSDPAYVSGSQTLPTPITNLSSLELQTGSTLTMFAGNDLVVPNGLFIDAGATLQGSGTVTGNVVNSGTIHIFLPPRAPGDGSTASTVTNYGTVFLGGSVGGGGGGGGGGIGIADGGGGGESTITNDGTVSLEGTGPDGSGGSGGEVVSAASVSNSGTMQFAPTFDGEFTFQGTFTQTASGKVIYDIRGATREIDYSFLHITSTAFLEGAFDVNLIDDYIPDHGQTFDIFQADGGITFGPSGLTMDLPPDFTWAEVDDDTVIELTYNGASVPEPVSGSLCVLGGITLLARRRNIRRRDSVN